MKENIDNDSGKQLPKFDNNDKRIRFYHLMLEINADSIPHYELPQGYRFVNYKDGDMNTWIEIEMSARELDTWEDGIRAWKKYYEPWENILSDRMFFIETVDGEKVATASAYFDITGQEYSEYGWLHWVAVKREYQGKHLSKALICHALEHLRDMGYEKIVVTTQTNTWLAVKIYMDFGFKPTKESVEESYTGWKIISRLTGHPTVSTFEKASDYEVTGSLFVGEK